MNEILKTEDEVVRWSVKKINDDTTLIEFELKRDLVPEDLKKINPPDAVKNKFANTFIVLSGRGPIWLYGFLIHFYHPTKGIGVFDPRLGGAVVVSSHSPNKKVGDVIKWEG
ncbi:CRISPR-associated ring nuclease Crn3/Csx3 [Aquifex aeolicus]|uniref:Uncharacterized protein aq_377 n=1 Tax=Aquifex aeolicus (strain VF5) TaxID=224324 RepID=Y377_AQUAE|nr:CRISPR-associated ring nuclease Crn3/Csx3 [Aquifex aeolicus]O66699.1 RecName: Full=Uncharacterized protein aq_377 [Aquifex aeolicus VF5]AAC06660.1 putative protein [Aquifex aeolicus VF5]